MEHCFHAAFVKNNFTVQHDALPRCMSRHSRGGARLPRNNFLKLPRPLKFIKRCGRFHGLLISRKRRGCRHVHIRADFVLRDSTMFCSLPDSSRFMPNGTRAGGLYSDRRSFALGDLMPVPRWWKLHSVLHGSVRPAGNLVTLLVV